MIIAGEINETGGVRENLMKRQNGFVVRGIWEQSMQRVVDGKFPVGREPKDRRGREEFRDRGRVHDAGRLKPNAAVSVAPSVSILYQNAFAIGDEYGPGESEFLDRSQVGIKPSEPIRDGPSAGTWKVAPG